MSSAKSSVWPSGESPGDWIAGIPVVGLHPVHDTREGGRSTQRVATEGPQ